jgi:phosphatidate cytidylyltransferase
MARRLAHDRATNLRKRAVSALVLGPLVLGVVYAGGWLFYAAVVVTAVLAVREWVRMIAPGPLGRSFYLSCAAIALVMVLDVAAGPLIALGGALALALVLAMVPWAGSARVRGADRRVAAFGVPYVGASCVALTWLRGDPQVGMLLILFLLLTVWANDIGAFVVGRAIGGPRLAPSISPAKTWAGFWGGVAAAGLVGGLVALVAGAREPLVVVVLGALLAVVGQGGDLFESAIKRRYKVKDSGQLIPGHGGLLDRIDGLVAAAPVLALFQVVMGSRTIWW